MSENLKAMYGSFLEGAAKFVRRGPGDPKVGFFPEDPACDWILNHYYWVSTAKTDEEYKARCKARRERKKRK